MYRIRVGGASLPVARSAARSLGVVGDRKSRGECSPTGCSLPAAWAERGPIVALRARAARCLRDTLGTYFVVLVARAPSQPAIPKRGP